MNVLVFLVPIAIGLGLIGLFAASFLSQLALSPLLVFYFRRMSLVGPLANLFAVPWGDVCLFLGVGLFFFDFFHVPGAGVCAWATEKSARSNRPARADLWR